MGVDGFQLRGSESLIQRAQLGLQVLHLLLVLLLVLLPLLLGGLPEMLQRLAGMLVLFFQRLAMAFFGRDALLQVGHLLREFKGLAAQRFAGFAMAGLFVGEGPLGLLQLLAGGLRLDFQGRDGLLVLGELFGVLGLRRGDPFLGFFRSRHAA